MKETFQCFVLMTFPSCNLNIHFCIEKRNFNTMIDFYFQSISVFFTSLPFSPEAEEQLTERGKKQNKKKILWTFLKCKEPSTSPPSAFHCVSVWQVPVFLGAWGLMVGLSGFASHRCNLHLGAGCQQWKLQDVLGTYSVTSTQQHSCLLLLEWA